MQQSIKPTRFIETIIRRLIKIQHDDTISYLHFRLQSKLTYDLCHTCFSLCNTACVTIGSQFECLPYGERHTYVWPHAHFSNTNWAKCTNSDCNDLNATTLNIVYLFCHKPHSKFDVTYKKNIYPKNYICGLIRENRKSVNILLLNVL